MDTLFYRGVFFLQKRSSSKAARCVCGKKYVRFSLGRESKSTSPPGGHRHDKGGHEVQGVSYPVEWPNRYFRDRPIGAVDAE